jgi:hypothetical protein
MADISNETTILNDPVALITRRRTGPSANTAAYLYSFFDIPFRFPTIFENNETIKVITPNITMYIIKNKMNAPNGPTSVGVVKNRIISVMALAMRENSRINPFSISILYHKG